MIEEQKQQISICARYCERSLHAANTAAQAGSLESAAYYAESAEHHADTAFRIAASVRRGITTCADAVQHARQQYAQALPALSDAELLEKIVTECEQRLGLIPTGDRWHG